MMGSTHLLIGLSGAVAYTSTTGQPLDSGVYLAAMAGALLPDIDHPQSLLGNFFSWVPRPSMLGHRKFTHSIWFVLGVGIFCFSQFGPVPWVMGLMWGILSHIGSDMLTEQGVPLLYGLRNRNFCLPIFRTGAFLERALVIALSLFVVLGLAGLYTEQCYLPELFCPSQALAAPK